MAILTFPLKMSIHAGFKLAISSWMFPELVLAIVALATISNLSLELNVRPPVAVPLANNDASERLKGMK